MRFRRRLSADVFGKTPASTRAWSRSCTSRGVDGAAADCSGASGAVGNSLDTHASKNSSVGSSSSLAAFTIMSHAPLWSALFSYYSPRTIQYLSILSATVLLPPAWEIANDLLQLSWPRRQHVAWKPMMSSWPRDCLGVMRPVANGQATRGFRRLGMALATDATVATERPPGDEGERGASPGTRPPPVDASAAGRAATVSGSQQSLLDSFSSSCHESAKEDDVRARRLGGGRSLTITAASSSPSISCSGSRIHKICQLF